MTDGLAVSLRQSGSDPEQFAEVYRAEAHRLLVFLARRTFDVEVARDMLAETFAQAFEKRRRFRGSTDAEAAGWLYAIARRRLARYARTGMVERKAVERLGIRVPAVAEDDFARVVELAGLADIRGRVAAAFSTLPAKQADALRLRIVDERSYPDVAAALGVSEQTARMRVSRALRQLAEAAEITLPTEVQP
jgi:RNA polymerase sigma-70 factor (ECF subfamily)